MKDRSRGSKTSAKKRTGCAGFFYRLDTEYIRPRLIYKYHKDVLYEYQAIQEELNASEGEEFEETLARGRLGMPSVTERVSFSGYVEQQHRPSGLLSQYIKARQGSFSGLHAPAFGGGQDLAARSPAFLDSNRTRDSA